uniref:Uncharacterized protein n=1 Tax=Triticum urartu TaxID=4572 RepID=A0A8R7QDC3_TRIUA
TYHRRVWRQQKPPPPPIRRVLTSAAASAASYSTGATDGFSTNGRTRPSPPSPVAGECWFCVLPMAQSLMSAAAYSVDYATDSVSAALKRPDIFSPLAYLPHLQLHRKQQTWFDGLEQSGVVADTKLIPCSTL